MWNQDDFYEEAVDGEGGCQGCLLGCLVLSSLVAVDIFRCILQIYKKGHRKL